MQKNENNIHSFPKSGVSSALWFSLAFLLLIVSCPLKRLLKNNFSASSVSATGNNQSTINPRTIASYNEAFDKCEVLEEPVLTADVSHKAEQQAPVYFLNIDDAAGFNTHYFLSRISYNPSSESLNSSFPLYLQHLRLLI